VVAHETTAACGLHVGSRYEFKVLVRRRQPNNTTPNETFVTRAAVANDNKPECWIKL
jgi:hypothetical protein